MCCTNWIIDDFNKELWNVKGSETIRSVHVSYFYPVLLIHHELISNMNVAESPNLMFSQEYSSSIRPEVPKGEH
jgi:hypothetical protein